MVILEFVQTCVLIVFCITVLYSVHSMSKVLSRLDTLVKRHDRILSSIEEKNDINF